MTFIWRSIRSWCSHSAFNKLRWMAIRKEKSNQVQWSKKVNYINNLACLAARATAEAGNQVSTHERSFHDKNGVLKRISDCRQFADHQIPSKSLSFFVAPLGNIQI